MSYWSKKREYISNDFRVIVCIGWGRRKNTKESSSCVLVAAAAGLWFFFVCFTFFVYGYAWSLCSRGVSSLQQQSRQLIRSSTSSHAGQLLMRPACLKGLATRCQRAAAGAAGSALWNSSPHTCNHKHLPGIAPRGRRGHSGHSRTTCKRKVNTGGLEKHLQMLECNMQKRKKKQNKNKHTKKHATTYLASVGTTVLAHKGL